MATTMRRATDRLSYLDVSGLRLVPKFSPSVTHYGIDTSVYNTVGVHAKAASTATITLEANGNTYTSAQRLGVSDLNVRVKPADGDSAYRLTVENGTTGGRTEYVVDVANNDGETALDAGSTDSDKLRASEISSNMGTLNFTPYWFDPETYEYTLSSYTRDTDITLKATPADYQSAVTWVYPYEDDADEAVEYENGSTIRFLNGESAGDVRVTKLAAKVTQPDGSDGQTYVYTINKTKPLDPAPLTSLALGSLTITPEFDGDTYTYAATTSDASNQLTAAVATEVMDGGSYAQIRVSLNGTEVNTSQSGSISQRLTWEDGENTVLVRTLWLGQYIWNSYTVTVTKE